MTKARSELLSTARTGSGIIMINFLPMRERPSHDFYSAAQRLLLSARIFKVRRCVTAIDHFVRRDTYLTVVKCTCHYSFPEVQRATFLRAPMGTDFSHRGS
jgi:hypothetical protein